MRLQRALSPRFKLVRQALVEATDGTGDFEQLPTGLERLPPPYACSCLPRTSASVGSREVWFIPTVALKGLGVELTFPIVFAR